MQNLSRTLTWHVPVWLVVPLVLVASLVGVITGSMVTQARSTPCPLDSSTCAEFGTFWEAWQLLRKEYVDPEAVQPTRMIDGAITGMADSLGDSGHTRYLNPEQARSEREALDARFEGIGVYLQIRDGQAIITEPMPGSPAEKAGILAGDQILAVNGQHIRDMELSKLHLLVRGPSGTRVTLTILHRGQIEPVDIEVERGEINVPSVAWRMLADQVAHIRLNQFSQTAGDEIRAATREARAQGATAIVLDLRNNPGGLLDQLVQVASEFLPEKTTILLEQDRDGKQRQYQSQSGGATLDLPLVVLVNQQSASSAEILAAALGEAKRATVIGVPTFGTATVLRPFDLKNGGELRIGITQWLTPSGKMVRGVGITPDEIVALDREEDALRPSDAAVLTLEQLRSSPDHQLVRALQHLGRLGQ